MSICIPITVVNCGTLCAPASFALVAQNLGGTPTSFPLTPNTSNAVCLPADTATVYIRATLLCSGQVVTSNTTLAPASGSTLTFIFEKTRTRVCGCCVSTQTLRILGPGEVCPVVITCGCCPEKRRRRRSSDCDRRRHHHRSHRSHRKPADCGCGFPTLL